MLKRKSNIWLFFWLLVSIGLACGLDEQTDEANELVREGNAQIKAYNEHAEKSDTLFAELLGDNLSKVEDLAAYKKENKAKFDELLNLFAQMEKSDAGSISKFEQASKLKLNEKFKEYLNAKILESKKRTDLNKIRALFVKSFLEEKDTARTDKLTEDYNKKADELSKEADELMKKADQIAKDNPAIIKTS